MKVFCFLFNDFKEKQARDQGIMSVYRLSHDRGSFFQRVLSQCGLDFSFHRFASRPYMMDVRRDKAPVYADVKHHPWP